MPGRAARTVFSCVVDEPSVLQLQAHYLVASILEIGNVSPKDVYVHTVADLIPEFARWLDRRGVHTIQVPRHRHLYCNKLQQLPTFSGMSSANIVLLDCDIFVVQEASWPQPKRVAAKRVDSANPPERVLRTVFSEAGLPAVPAEADLIPGPEGRTTLRNNCNGGAYVIAGAFVKTLAETWNRWADWCLERQQLFESFSMHIDQVAFALALADLGVDAESLDRRFNLPTHIPLPSSADCAAVALHYHRNLDDQLLLRPVGLPNVDAAIASANQRLQSWRSRTLLNSLFFGARYQLFPELGSGVGSHGQVLEYKRALLKDLTAGLRDPSVLEIGFGNLAVSSVLDVRRYTGLDAAPSAIEKAKALRPDWSFKAGSPLDPGVRLDAADLVLCLDVLIHQPTREHYEKLLSRLCELAEGTLIVSGYDDNPVFTSSITYYYEPLTESLARIGGFDEVIVVGGYRDVTVVVARRNRGPRHARDMAGKDVTLMSHLVDDPLMFRKLIDLARSAIGFFPAHNPRAIEYTWIASRLGRKLNSAKVLDIGAGVNPLPLWLAEQGAEVTTVDSHPTVRDTQRRQDWNEWGFLDYRTLDGRIQSIHTAFEELPRQRAFDVLYSVSVIEHLSTQVRNSWIRSFAGHLRPGGRLLLTVDLVPWTDELWPFREGVLVEDPATHGTLRNLVAELVSLGFAVSRLSVRRRVPQCRVGLALIEARLRGERPKS